MNQVLLSRWHPSWEPQTFFIHLTTGQTVMVRGEILGPWGLHESSIGTYSLTHLVSGRRVVWGRDEEAVRSIAEDVPLEPWLLAEPSQEVRSQVNEIADRRGLQYKERE